MVSAATREIATLDVVTVYAGIMVSDRLIGAVYDVCGWMLDDPGIMTHQLPAAATACMPALAEQHPWLADLDPPRGDLTALRTWCADLLAQHGPTLTVRRPDSPPWVTGNALRDLADIADGKPIIVIKPGGTDE